MSGNEKPAQDKRRNFLKSLCIHTIYRNCSYFIDNLMLCAIIELIKEIDVTRVKKIQPSIDWNCWSVKEQLVVNVLKYFIFHKIWFFNLICNIEIWVKEVRSEVQLSFIPQGYRKHVITRYWTVEIQERKVRTNYLSSFSSIKPDR